MILFITIKDMLTLYFGNVFKKALKDFLVTICILSKVVISALTKHQMALDNKSHLTLLIFLYRNHICNAM